METKYIVFICASIVLVGCALLLFKRRQKILSFLFRDLNVFLVLQHETLRETGFGGSYIDLIKSLVIYKYYLKRKFTHPITVVLLGMHVRKCTDRLLYELEQLKIFDYDSEHRSIYSFTAQWWKIRHFLFKKDYRKDNGRYDSEKITLNEFFDLQDFTFKKDGGGEIVFSGNFSEVSNVQRERIEAKVFELCYNHSKILLQKEAGYSLVDTFLAYLEYESRRHPEGFKMGGIAYDFISDLIKGLGVEICQAFKKEIDEANDPNDMKATLERLEGFERSFLMRRLEGGRPHEETWFSDDAKGFLRPLAKIIELKKDLVCFRLGKEAKDAVERVKYLNMIKEPDFRNELAKCY